jgi:hypothetical protein
MRDAGPAQTDLKSALEEMRASVAGAGTRTGLAGMVEEAFLKLLEVLMALLMDFRAGNLAPLLTTADAAPDADAARAEDAEDAACAASAAPGEPAASRSASGWRGWWPGSWFRRHDGIPASEAVIESHSAPASAVCTLPLDSERMGPGFRRDDGFGRHLRRNDEENKVDQRVLVTPAKVGVQYLATAGGCSIGGHEAAARGTREPQEFRASPRPQRRRIVARRTQTNLVVWARRRDTRGIRRAFPPYSRDDGHRRVVIFEKTRPGAGGLARSHCSGIKTMR